MTYNKTEKNKLMDMEDDPRVTKIGRILRRTAMDELPVLINIFKGDVSFVGPKPLPFEIGSKDKVIYKELSDVPGYVLRSTVKPGLTGIAQIYLPKSVSRKDKFHYDNLYVRKKSMKLDLKLICLSFWIAFRGKWESRKNKI
jgi:lipopolysaccharide/colanic/teichoic acid biosynthesis glycosyltransferase